MPELPTTFGKYFLTEKLATGGMAEIYLAKIVGPGGFEKQLVIKQIHPKLSGQRHFVDLFVAEAKTLVTLTHGNIVPVYELGVVDDTYFIAMEYIDGPTLYRLTEMLSRRDAAMDPNVAAWITARMLEGLDYAHRKGEGVIHRDLSPRNVMLSRDGEIKLVDFGIAVTLGNAGEDETAKSAPTGSFPYMSPEQVRKEQLTGQTDVFSVGVLAWEMLVGHRLFARNDPDATLHAVTEEEIPRPSAHSSEIPPKLDEIVMRALERDKTARWANAEEMLGAIQRYLYGLEEMPGPRDVAALVAKYCPPETRRMPTHAEPLSGPDGDEAASIGETEATPPPSPAAGPRTAVIPRDGSQPRGKAKYARHKSFATNIELKDMLERATPMFGVQAVDESESETNVEAPAGVETRPAPPPQRSVEDPDSTMKIRTESDRDPGTAPNHLGLVLLAVGGLGLAVAAVIVFWKMRDAGGLQPDAAPRLDQPFYLLPDASIDSLSPEAALADASLDAPPLDAPVSDAPLAPPRDAAVRLPVDAAVTAPVVDAKSAPTGTATVEIGAEPWGDIVVDGRPRGRTPTTLTLSAGKHTVEVIFGGDDPPRTKTYALDLAPGATEKKFADFTKP